MRQPKSKFGKPAKVLLTSARTYPARMIRRRLRNRYMVVQSLEMPYACLCFASAHVFVHMQVQKMTDQVVVSIDKICSAKEKELHVL